MHKKTLEQRPERDCTIVLIEDNPGDVYLVREALEANGVDCEMETYTSGEHAIRQLSPQTGPGQQRVPNLLILDWNLPAVGGAEVLRAIRAWPRLNPMPVVVLTSSGSPRDTAEALRLGATRVIRKPTGLDDFLRHVGGEVRVLLRST